MTPDDVRVAVDAACEAGWVVHATALRHVFTLTHPDHPDVGVLITVGGVVVTHAGACTMLRAPHPATDPAQWRSFEARLAPAGT